MQQQAPATQVPPQVVYYFPLSETGLLNILEDNKIPENIRLFEWAPISRVVPTTYLKDNKDFKKFMGWADIIAHFTLMRVPDYEVTWDDIIDIENSLFYVNMQLLKALEGFFWRAINPTREVKKSLKERLLGRLRGE